MKYSILVLAASVAVIAMCTGYSMNANLLLTQEEDLIASDLLKLLEAKSPLEPDDVRDFDSVLAQLPNGNLEAIFTACSKKLRPHNGVKINQLGIYLNIPIEKINEAQFVTRESDLPLAIRGSIFVPQSGYAKYFEIAAKSEKSPDTKPFEHSCPEALFVDESHIPLNRNKYIYWEGGFPGGKPTYYSKWAYFARKIERGFGMLGLPSPSDLEHATIAPASVIYHPNAEKSARYFFDLIEKGDYQRSFKGTYQVGLLLGYFEPNVYAFIFGTERAKLAFPLITFNKEHEPSFDLPAELPSIEKLKEGLEQLGGERAIVLYEYPNA